MSERIVPFQILMCFLLFFPTVWAQNRFDQWTTENGLPQNSVRGIVQTSDGYLWMTTLDGLVRFDGVKFTVFNKSNSKNLPGNRFVNLFAEADDTLWIGTEEQGLVRYARGDFRTFTTADGLPSNYINNVFVKPDGNLYAVSVEGLTRFDGTRFVPVAAHREFAQSRTLAAASGANWEINKESLTVTKDEQKSAFELPAAIKSLFHSEFDFHFSSNLFEDREGNLWISINSLGNLPASNHKIFKFTAGKFEEITIEGTPRSPVVDFGQDQRGAIWIATIADGACRFEQNKFECFNTKNKLASDYVWKVFTDREGTLWLTTEDKGIYRVSEQIVHSFSMKEGLAAEKLYAIFQDRSAAVWLGSLGALGRYKDGATINYTARDGLIYTEIQSVFEDSCGRLWVGGFGGIQFFENGVFHDFMPNVRSKMDSFTFFAVHEDHRGILWFATTSGLIRYDGENSEVFRKKDGLPGNNVKTILENADGSLWIGTYEGIALFQDGKFTAYTEADGLAGNHVRALYKDETGALWIGTYESGLSRFVDGKFTNFTTDNGLSSNGVFQILEDDGKNFWISSNQGIYRVARAQLDDFADGKIPSITSTMFGKSDGMLSTEANGGGQPAGIKTRDGRLWFPTQDGAAPLLGFLQDNGGSTQTHALLTGSPAIDKGNSFGLTTDQRGFTRPIDFPSIPNATGGNGADIGAFETQIAPTAASVSISGRVTTASGRGITNVNLFLTDSSGQVAAVRTNPFGYYRFDQVQAGETYILSAIGKRPRSASQFEF